MYEFQVFLIAILIFTGLQFQSNERRLSTLRLQEKGLRDYMAKMGSGDPNTLVLLLSIVKQRKSLSFFQHMRLAIVGTGVAFIFKAVVDAYSATH